MQTIITKKGKLACNITSDELQQIKKDLRPTTRRNDSLFEIFKQIAEEEKNEKTKRFEKDASQYRRWHTFSFFRLGTQFSTPLKKNTLRLRRIIFFQRQIDVPSLHSNSAFAGRLCQLFYCV